MHLPFLLAPLLLALSTMSSAAHEHEHEHEHENSLGAHVHGIATLDIALEDQVLELQLHSPAMNIVGFEYQPRTAADKKKVRAAERLLTNQHTLFSLTPAAGCSLTSITLDNDLTEQHEHEHEHEPKDTAKDQHVHNDIAAHYIFNCATPQQLKHIDLANFFSTFPATEKINVQLITEQAQQGAVLTPSSTALNW